MVTTWVLLRGLGRGAGHWGDFPAQWQQAFPEARLVTPEWPGNGSRFAERSPVCIGGMVDDLRAGLQSRGLAPPYHVLALSLGAMAAVDWAARRPDEVASMVLVNTSLRPVNPAWQRMRPTAFARLLASFVASTVTGTHGAAERRERAVLALTARMVPDADKTLVRWVSLQRTQPVSAANLMRQLRAASRYRAAACAPRTPTLLLSSRCDALVDPRCSTAIARHWHLPLRQHPKAGHDLPLDDGTWVAGEVAAWLARDIEG